MRLNRIADFIPPYRNIADIGCDHGLLIKKAFSKGIDFAQAIDNKIGPLESAKQNLSQFNEQILFSLSNGLDQLDNRIEVIILAGMGAELVVRILQENINKLSNIKRIIIQVNRHPEKIREFMGNIAFKIVSEAIIFERKHFYEIIVFEQGEEHLLSEEILFGPILLKEKNPLFLKKWQKEYNKIKELNNPLLQLKKQFIEKHIIKGE